MSCHNAKVEANHDRAVLCRPRTLLLPQTGRGRRTSREHTHMPPTERSAGTWRLPVRSAATPRMSGKLSLTVGSCDQELLQKVTRGLGENARIAADRRGLAGSCRGLCGLQNGQSGVA
jgi:hypothetical protein